MIREKLCGTGFNPSIQILDKQTAAYGLKDNISTILASLLLVRSFLRNTSIWTRRIHLLLPLYSVNDLANWPILESILSDWEQSISQQDGFLNSQILIEKARQIWPQIPQYQHLPTPEFSVDWLANFKKHHHIQKRAQHGEASSTPLSAAEEMKNIRTLCGKYDEGDVYNMDETGLFWRRAPSSGLSSISLSNIKKDKTRITLVVCVNCTGADHLPLWIIGNSKMPRSLHGLNIQALGGVWTSNKKSWMTSLIMKYWLLAFYYWTPAFSPSLNGQLPSSSWWCWISTTTSQY